MKFMNQCVDASHCQRMGSFQSFFKKTYFLGPYSSSAMANEPTLLWPQRRILRSARSTLAFTFDRQVMGAVIPSRVHYSFADSLLHENLLVIERKNSDPVYRGEVHTLPSLNFL
jgi:hypothetical protein